MNNEIHPNTDNSQAQQPQAVQTSQLNTAPVQQPVSFSDSQKIFDTTKNNTNRKKLIILGSIGVVITIFGIGFFAYSQTRMSQDNDTISVEQASKLTDKQIEKKVTEKIEEITKKGPVEEEYLSTFKTQFLKPTASIYGAVLTKSASPDGNEMLTYGIGYQTSTPSGRISVLQFKTPATFNPPTNCGPYYPNGIKATSPLPCRAVVKKENYIGYAYEGVTPGGIDYVSPSGKGITMLTLYAKINDTVVVVQGIDVGADTIVSYMDSMATIKADDFPEDTRVVK